jgi:hypothetical protein
VLFFDTFIHLWRHCYLIKVVACSITVYSATYLSSSDACLSTRHLLFALHTYITTCFFDVYHVGGSKIFISSNAKTVVRCPMSRWRCQTPNAKRQTSDDSFNHYHSLAVLLKLEALRTVKGAASLGDHMYMEVRMLFDFIADSRVTRV